MTRIAPTVARILLGLVFLVFGLNYFVPFLPTPPMEGPAAAFAGALFATGYMFPLIKGIEVLAGALLLAGRFVPLALLLLAPIVVNIAAFHVFLTPARSACPPCSSRSWPSSATPTAAASAARSTPTPAPAPEVASASIASGRRRDRGLAAPVEQHQRDLEARLRVDEA
jgi:uncharacterized membrane protein YphA (DoxX/SURF4 family)